MIITLSEEFDQFSRADWIPYLPAIQNLLICHTQGWHFFVPSRRVAEVLSTLDELSHNHRTLIRVQIGEKLATLSGQMRSARFVLKCVVNLESDSLDDRELVLPISSLFDLEQCFKSRLIVENGDSDGIFYTKIAKALSSKGFASIPLALDIVHGGGATTASKVRDAVREARPSLIIVDGDRRFPGDREGDTARQVRDAFSGKNFPTSILHITEVKSVENFIPCEFGNLFLSGRNQSIDICKLVHDHTSAEIEIGIPNNRLTLMYYCFKKGFRVEHYRKAGKPFRDAVGILARTANSTISFPALNDNSRDNETIVPGINSRYIELFLEHLSKDVGFASDCLSNFPKTVFFSELEKIVDKIVAFGIAPKRLFIDLDSASAMAA